MSPVLKGRFLTTGPPGKSLLFLFLINYDRKAPYVVIMNICKRYVEAPLKIIFRLESGREVGDWNHSGKGVLGRGNRSQNN